MNKMNFVATAVALSALCLAGCSNDAEEPGTEPQPGRQVMMTMQASTAEPQTRADYTEEDGDVMRFSWRANDAISVLVGGYALGPNTPNQNCELTTKEEGKIVTFTGPADAWDGTRNIYAVYPYKKSNEFGDGYYIDNPETLSDADVDLTLANPQEFTVGGAFTNGFLVGAGTATVEGGQIKVSPVSMKQVVSFVRFNITKAPGKVTQVTMAGKKPNDPGSKLIFPTVAFVYMSTGKISLYATYETELTMNVTDNTDSENKSVSFALWPIDYSDVEFTITITFEGGEVKTLTKKGMKFERNVHYVVEVDATDAQPASK